MAERGYSKKLGARPLGRLIDNEVKSPLSRKILFGDLSAGGLVNVSVLDSCLRFEISDLPKILTKEEKKAAKLAKILENVDEDQHSKT